MRVDPRGSLTDVDGIAVGHHHRIGRGWRTGTTVVLALMFGPVLLVFGLVALAAAWSRTVLDDHSVPQVVVGLCLGAAVAAAVFGTLR